MAFVHSIPVRFPDVDFARVVYYPKFFDYCHQAFEAFFEQEVKVPYPTMLKERGIGFPTVHAESDFVRPLRFGDTARIVLETVSVSPRSLGCRYRFFDGQSDQLCAEIRIVTAAVLLEKFASTPLPEDVRAAFSRHVA